MLTAFGRNIREAGSNKPVVLLVALVAATSLIAACDTGSPTDPDPVVDATPAPTATPTPGPTPAPTPTPVAVCVPNLVLPAHGATMDNGRSDGLDELIWDFDWDDCPGADLYHLYVRRSGGAAPVIDRDDLAGSSYNHGTSSFIASGNLTGWTWMVRARVAGHWGDWSPQRPFKVEAPNSDPPNTCVPILSSPAEGATLDNGRTDHTNQMVWTFDWAGCPGATRYHLYVKRSGSSAPSIDKDDISGSGYQRFTTDYVASGHLTGWTWKVRAKTSGVWGAWSPARSFEVEPPNTD